MVGLQGNIASSGVVRGKSTMCGSFARKLIPACISGLLLFSASFGQTITTNSLSLSTVCQGGTTNVTFTSTGTFNPGNVYTAQLSDASGSFATPVPLSPALTSSASGTFTINNVVIPLATPAGTGYRIRVISSDPAVTDAGLTIIVNALPVPIITGSNTTCVSSAARTYSTQPGMSGYSWAVSPDGSFTGNGTNTINITWTTPGTKTINVTYTDANGCTGTSAPLYVTVTAPTITGPSSVCVGSTGNNYTTETGMTGYSWNISGGNITSGNSTPSVYVTWNTVGSRSISIIYTNASGCRNSGAATVYQVMVNANPSVPTAGSNSRCGAGTVTINATPGAGETIDWYAGATGGTALLSGNTSFTTPSISSTTVYYAEARNISAGCVSATRTAVTATVNPLPSAPAAGNHSRCGTGTVTLTATPSAGETVDWYDASSGGTLLLSGNTSFTTPSISVTTSYYAEARNTTTGCVSATRTTVTATVTPSPDPPAAGNNQRCGTGTVTIYATPGTGETVDWYAAATGGTPLLAGNTNYTTPSISVTTIYYAEARNTTTGCVSATRTPVTATINPVPVPSLTGSPAACAGSTGNVYTTDAGMTNYLWTVSAGGTITAGSGTNSVTVTWNTTGARNVSVNYTNAQGCTGASPAVLNVTVNAAPAPTISGPATACQGGSTIYTYTTESGMSNYVWAVTGGIISSGGGPNDNTATIIWNTLGAQSVSVNYTSGGCAGGTPAVRNVTVIPRPVPAFNGPTTVCQGLPYVYSTDPGMSGYTWSISYGGNIVSGNGTYSVTVVWNTALPQTLGVNYANASGCRGLSNTSANITVNPTNQPVITGPVSVCAGAAGNVYTTQAGMSNYVWNVSSGGTITAGGGNTNSVTVTWTTPGTQDVTVNFTNSYGCTPTGASLYHVTVNPLPSPTITGPPSACIGSAGNIYTTEPGMTNYSWVVSAGGTITAGAGTNSVTVAWNNVGAQTVSVNYVNASGCITTAPTVNNITVHPLPVATITGPDPVCAGSAGNVYTTQPGMTNYVWTVPAGGTITSGGGSSDNTVTVTWNTAGSRSVTVRYTNANGCPSAPVSTPVTVTPLPTASISYSGSPWCTTAGIQNVTLTGTGGYSGGSFSASPAGLTINAATGAITPSTSSQGNYTVSYTTPAAGGCSPVIVTTEVAITSSPSATIYYVPNSYCSNSGIVPVTRTGTAGGTYSATPAGLTIDPVTGAVNTGTSTPGTYTVRYSITPSGGCSPFSTQATISITRLPVATFSYTGSPYCQTAANPFPAFSGGGVAGTFSAAPAGLVFVNTATGQVNLAASAPGTYTVTNTVAATGPCPVVTATSQITVSTQAAATISYPQAAYCAGAGTIPVTFTGTTGGTFSASPAAGLSIDPLTGAVNTGTSTPGAYTVTYNIPASGGCIAVNATTPLTVNALPLAFTGPDRLICAGASVVLGAAPITGHTYSWTSNPAGFTSSLANPSVSPAENTTYTLTEVITATGCTSTNSVTITANQVIVVTITPTSQSICSGGTTNIQLSSNIAGTAFTWNPVLLEGLSTTGFSAGSGPLIAQTITNTSGSPSVVQYTIAANASGCSNTQNTVNITINPVPATPVITAGGPTSFCLGGSVVLTSTVSAGYQWYLDGNPIPGATGRTHTAATGGSYTVRITDANGCFATSAATTVTITPTPAITNMNSSVCSGGTFTVSPVNGTDGTVPPGTTYSWSAPGVTGGITGGAAGSGASITGTLTNPTSSPHTATYTVTPTAGPCTGAPFTVVVTVNPAPAVTPMTATACSGASFTVTPVNGTNGLVPAGTSYSWGAPTVSGAMTGGAAGTGSAISGTLNNPTNVPQTATYAVTPSFGGCNGTVFNLTVTVNPTPAISNLTAVVCEGGTFNVHPVNITDGIVPANTTYSWPVPVVTGGLGGGAVGVGMASIAGVLTNPTNSTQTATYTVTPVSAGCTGNTFTVTVSVNPVPEINNMTSTICSGSAFSVTPADGVNGVVPPATLYSWGAPSVTGGMTGGSAGTNQAGIGATLINPTNTVQTATYTVTPSVGTCPGDNFTVTVTVNPTPSVSNKTVSTCGGVPFTVAPVNGTDIVPAGTTYSWPAPSLPAGLTGGAAGNNAASISGTLINTTNNALTATYTVTPRSGICTGNTFTVTVTVNPAPAISNKTVTVCSGTAFTVTPVNGPDVVPAGTTYSWPAPGAQSGVGGLAAGTNQPNISATLTNSNNTPRTVVYTVTPSITGCTGAPFTVTVTINPTPPTYLISFYQFNPVPHFQRCDGQDVYTQNDIDILLQPGNTQPPSNYFGTLGYTSWRYESSTSPSGPWVPASGTLTVYHQFILPVPPSPYSPIGNYYFRLAILNNGYGCSSFSAPIWLEVTSTLNIDAGPDINDVCQSPAPVARALTGAAVTGTSTTTRGGTWSIQSGSGTLSNTGFTTNPAGVTFTPAANFSGTVVLLLTSNDPDGGGPCRPLTDTRTITVAPAPSVTPGPAVTICSSSSPDAITLAGAGFGGSATTAAWSITNIVPANGGNNGSLSSTAQTADPASVTYTPPAGYTGTVTLTLTTNSGACTPASGTRTITIRPMPVCSITGSNDVCPGSTNIYSEPLGMSSYSWSVTAGTATIPGSSTSQTVSVAAPANCSSYTLSLTIVDANGCTNTCTQTFSSADSQNPVINCPLTGETVVDANSGTTYVHNNNSWNATATDNCGTPLLGYTLTGATTGTGTSLNGVTFNEGLTTVTWTATDLCGHTVSCSYNIRVNASSDLAVTKTASPSPVNAGAVLTYTITLTNTGSAAAQNVVITDNIAFFTNTPQYALNAGGPWNNWTGSYIVPGTIPHNGTYTIYIRGNVPCAQLTNTVSVTSTNDNNPANNQATVITQVQDNEYPDFSFCPPLQQVCTVSGNTYTHSGTGWDAIGTDDCGVASLTYTMTGASTGTGTSLNGAVFNAGVTIVTWTVTDNSGRYATCDFNVTVNLNEECSITGPDNICSGTINTYTGPATIYPYNPYTYSWSVTAGTAVIQGSNTGRDVQVQAPAGGGTYTLSLTVTNLCGSTTCNHTYTVRPLPAVTVNSPAVCEGDPATVTATPGTPGTYNYVWAVPPLATNPGNVASFTTTVGGIYSVVITDPATTCSSASASGTVTVSPLPVTSPIYHQ